MGASFGSGFAVWLGKQTVNGTADLIKNNPGYENYGYSLVTGDFNADGYCDIAIAASHEYDPWPSGNFNGYVWVFGGNAQLEDTTVANEDPVLIPEQVPLKMRYYPNPHSGDYGSISYEIEGKLPSHIDQAHLTIHNIKG